MNYLLNTREIDKEEFKKVMGMMRAQNRQGSQHRDGLRAGLKVAGSVEDGGLVEYFFGEDGKKSLQVNKFIQFLNDLHNEVCEANYPHNYTKKSFVHLSCDILTCFIFIIICHVLIVSSLMF